MNLIYNVKDKPPFGKTLVFAFQQVLAILAATILVPAIIGNGMSQSAALFGAGVGTLVYQLFTKFRSPVFLGSSFAFISSMLAAFAGATTLGGAVNLGLGYLGLIIGAVMAGLVLSMELADAAVTIDADLQDDVNAIVEMADKFNAGYEVV